MENNYRVLIAACDTFRAGAVEQLRTHVRHLNALHPEGKRGEMVSLYEQGYGKDAADIARVAIEHGRKNDYDVVLVDTAGRMQDNEPLMRALAKVLVNILNLDKQHVAPGIYTKQPQLTNANARLLQPPWNLLEFSLSFKLDLFKFRKRLVKIEFVHFI